MSSFQQQQIAQLGTLSSTQYTSDLLLSDVFRNEKREMRGQARAICYVSFCRGSSASRSPSPIRLNASTVRKIMIPGAIAMCG